MTLYLDHAASSPPREAVLGAMLAAARDLFGNPSSAHAAGAAAARALEDARASVAETLGANPREVLFTSGGTEANALAILGQGRSRSRHAVVSSLEHPAVLRNAELLATQGWEVTRVAPDASGVVTVAALAEALRPDTGLVCLMAVNNEVGTVQPCAELGALLASRRPRPHFHVDAVQAFGHLPLRAQRLQADSLALSAHKIGGPRGVGALWLRAGAKLEAFYGGGGQERGLRSGTENLPAIVGFGVAAREVARPGGDDPDGEAARAAMARRRDDFEATCLARIPGTRRTVEGAPRAPHIASLRLPSLPAEPILHALEARGVLASAGSACASRARGQSHVLRALGVPASDAVLRFSLGPETSATDLTRAAEALVASVAEIRGVAKPSRLR